MQTATDGDQFKPVPAAEGLAPHLRLLFGQLSDAVALHASGSASRADIDVAMRLGAGYSQGPFEVLAEMGSDAARFGVVAEHVVEQEQADDGVTAPEWVGPAAVVGTGHMAAGIVEAIARSGRPVTVLGRSAESLGRLVAAVTRSVDRSLAKGRLSSADAAGIRDAISPTTQRAALAEVDVVVEAVAEDLAVKQELFAGLDAALPQSVTLASNTSSFGIAEIAGEIAARRPVLGLHFFNPAQVMKLVEVISVGGPGSAVAPTARAWVRALGKTPVACADSRGFIVNRLLIPFLNDAAREHEGGAGVEEIDTLMVERAGHPMGPFALIDLIGLDITVATLASMAEVGDDPRLVPAGVLHDLIAEGRLGRKSGRGFHDYGATR